MGDSAVGNPELAAELRRRAEVDQEVRRFTSMTDAEIDRLRQVDADNRSWFAKVIDEHGWPGWAMVGEQGANDAWLIAQHADLDLEFQRRCLLLLRQAVAESDGSAKDLAYLEDRVLVAEGRPQVYGTQGRPGEDGLWTATPISEPDQVDARRASVGLAPMADYTAQIRGIIARGGIGDAGRTRGQEIGLCSDRNPIH